MRGWAFPPGASAKEAQAGRKSCKLDTARLPQLDPLPSSPYPHCVSGHTGLDSLGLQHLQQLWRHRWPDVRFCQQWGEKRKMKCRGRQRGTGDRLRVQCVPLPPPASIWQNPSIFPSPGVMISLPLPLGEKVSPTFSNFSGFQTRELKAETARASEDIFSPVRPHLGWGVGQEGALRAAAGDTQPPTKPQTLSIFSGTKHVCGMRSSTQLPLEQEPGE